MWAAPTVRSADKPDAGGGNVCITRRTGLLCGNRYLPPSAVKLPCASFSGMPRHAACSTLLLLSKKATARPLLSNGNAPHRQKVWPNAPRYVRNRYMRRRVLQNESETRAHISAVKSISALRGRLFRERLCNSDFIHLRSLRQFADYVAVRIAFQHFVCRS